ncbi:hypothetical protein [Paenibacillus sp. NPDC058071]|uniref:hypothetical protein n=1 Tax=Paenibacillus sp. NPDC058071 TaxID=3346326 RepID=UPI0036DBA05A
MNADRLAERQIKLSLISAIAQSQLALARILGSVAQFSEWSPELARHIGENVRLLTALQESLTASAGGLSLPGRVKRSAKPAGPWLNPKPGSIARERG